MNLLIARSIWFMWFMKKCHEFTFTLLFQDEDLEALLAADFEIGHFIRERIVPRAVLYFTGEALENDEVWKYIALIMFDTSV